MKLVTYKYLVPRLIICKVFLHSPTYIRGVVLRNRGIFLFTSRRRVYPKVSGLAAWSENCKWYGFLPLGAVVALFYESV
jgi:hypothetical protein